MKIVSACLCGLKCDWKGSDKLNPEILEMVKRGEAIPVCPEQLGGMPTPREPCEQIGDKVFSKTGKEHTYEYERGANEVLRIAKAIGANEFIGRRKSTSCSTNVVYDGTFSDTLVSGDGVTAKLFKENGIKTSNA